MLLLLLRCVCWRRARINLVPDAMARGRDGALLHTDAADEKKKGFPAAKKMMRY